MNIEQLIEKIESAYTIGASTDHSRAVTGETYVTIGAPADKAVMPKDGWGTINEGAVYEDAFDEETACNAAWSSFQQYADGRHGVLYWRVRPKLIWNEWKTRCLVRMRCLISDKRPVSVQDAGYLHVPINPTPG